MNARGIPTSAYQVLHLLPFPGVTYLGQGVPTLVGGTYLGWGWVGAYLGWGVPTLAGGYLPWLGVTYLGVPPPHLNLARVPPPRCGQTDTCENSTLPSCYVRGR